MKVRVLMASVLAALVAASVWGCGAKKPKPVTPVVEVVDAGSDAGEPEDAGPKLLYDRLGGKEGVAALIDALINNVTHDPELKKAFAKTKGDRLEAFKKNLADQLCEATGGPCKYAGKDMATAHKGLKVTEKQWNSFIERFTDALNEQKVADAEQSEILAILAPMKDQIVTAGKKK